MHIYAYIYMHGEAPLARSGASARPTPKGKGRVSARPEWGRRVCGGLSSTMG